MRALGIFQFCYIRTFLLNVQNNALEWCGWFFEGTENVSMIAALKYTTQKNLLLSVPDCYVISSVPQRWGYWGILYLLYQNSFILTINLEITSRSPQARLCLYTWRYLVLQTCLYLSPVSEPLPKHRTFKC